MTIAEYSGKKPIKKKQADPCKKKVKDPYPWGEPNDIKDAKIYYGSSFIVQGEIEI